jgi:DNA-binding IclR family transcriptional regulator
MAANALHLPALMAETQDLGAEADFGAELGVLFYLARLLVLFGCQLDVPGRGHSPTIDWRCLASEVDCRQSYTDLLLFRYVKHEIPPNETLMQKPEANRYTVASIQKALDVLEIVAFAAHGLSLQEIASRVDQPKATVFRLLSNLEERNYVRRTAQGLYYLGSRTQLLGEVATQRYTIRSVALPKMEELRDCFGHTVSLAVRLASRILYIGTAEGTHSLRFVEPPSTTGPLHATALGKALLAWSPAETRRRLLSDIAYDIYTPSTVQSSDALTAELDRAREQGYAVDNEESVKGARCVAVPIFDADGTVVAALSISGPSGALGDETLPEVVAELRTASAAISSYLQEGTDMS